MVPHIEVLQILLGMQAKTMLRSVLPRPDPWLEPPGSNARELDVLLVPAHVTRRGNGAFLDDGQAVR